MRNAIAVETPGSEVTLNVFRDHKWQDVKVKLGEQPGDETALSDSAAGHELHGDSALGIRLENLNSDLAQQFGLTETSGVVVTQVSPNSPAAQAGLQPGDLIVRINGHHITSPGQVADLLSKMDLKAGVQLQVENRQGSELIFVKSN